MNYSIPPRAFAYSVPRVPIVAQSFDDEDDELPAHDEQWACAFPEECIVADLFHHRSECMTAADAEWMHRAQEECEEEWIGIQQQMEWRGLWASLRQRCKKDDSASLTRLQRWGYVLKLFLCYLFHLRHDWRVHGEHPDCVTTGVIHSGKTYAGWEADWMEVGEGWDANWFYAVSHDSEWNM